MRLRRAPASRQEAIRAAFRQFADVDLRRLPLYARICDGVAGDPELLDLMAVVPDAQLRPNLLLNAAHFLVLDGCNHRVGDWYPTVAAEPRVVGDGADDPYPAFRALCLDHRAELEGLLATRATQTNEVGRCTTLLPALAGVADDGARPLGLVEVGASAGLNLLLDRYAYTYDPGGRVGGPSAVELVCKVRGGVPVPVPPQVPPVAFRVGLDLEPVDVTDTARTRWLEACVWPEQRTRVERFRAALEVARSDPPRVVAGDAVDDVGALVDAVPEPVVPVVISTWALAYLSEDRQRAFMSVLDRLGADRDVSYVFAEQPAEVPGLPVPRRPDGVDDERFTALVRFDWRRGRRTATRLADQHPHGTWVTWLHPHG